MGGGEGVVEGLEAVGAAFWRGAVVSVDFQRYWSGNVVLALGLEGSTHWVLRARGTGWRVWRGELSGRSERRARFEAIVEVEDKAEELWGGWRVKGVGES